MGEARQAGRQKGRPWQRQKGGWVGGGEAQAGVERLGGREGWG